MWASRSGPMSADKLYQMVLDATESEELAAEALANYRAKILASGETPD